MAFPFGGHPTLQQLLAFAEANGCHHETKVRAREDGQTYVTMVVTAPSGSSVVIVDPDLAEYLAPSMVTYYQRRLGIKTPFAAMPEHPPE